MSVRNGFEERTSTTGDLFHSHRQKPALGCPPDRSWAFRFLCCVLACAAFAGCTSVRTRIDNAIVDLESDSIETADNAADTLVRIGVPCVAPLARAAETKWHVWQAAKHVLTRIGPSAIAPLLAETDYGPDSHKLAVAVLHRIGRPGMKCMLEWLKNEDNSGRGAVVTALGMLADRAAVDVLLEVAAKDKDSNVRGSAVWALGCIGDVRARPFLLQMFDDPLPRVRELAVGAIASMGDRQSAPALVRLLATEKDTAVRSEIAAGLGKLANEKTGDSILKALKSERHRRAYELLIWALGCTHTKAAAPRLREIVQQWGGRLRLEANGALAKLGEQAAMAKIVAIAKNKTIDVEIRGRATELIGEAGAEANLATLGELLADDTLAFSKYYAAKALAKVADETVADVIIGRLQSDERGWNPLADLYCIEALRRVPSPRVTKLLCRLLRQHGYWSVRRNAAHVLGDSKDPEARPALIAALGDRDSFVRRAAAGALGKLGPSAASKTALRRVAAEDDVQVVREAAQKALDALNGKHAP